MQNMTHPDALIAKNYILAYQKINFYYRNFFVRNFGEKSFLNIVKYNWRKMQNITVRDVVITKNYI